MRLRPELSRLALLLLLALAAPVSQAAEPLSEPEVTRAIEKMKADPDLATETTVRRLTWKSTLDAEKKPERESRNWQWLEWLFDLFRWIGETSQMLAWLLIGAFVAALAVLIYRLVRSRHSEGTAARFMAPTHVQDLDIRPESLPDDVGAAARQLWDRGEHRAALALLYRALLSRLAHVYQVPIRDSSTEGDCLRLAGRVLPAQRLEYATRLVRTWQRAIYGGLHIEDSVVHELCAGFDQYLERAAAAAGSATPDRDEFARGAAA